MLNELRIIWRQKKGGTLPGSQLSIIGANSTKMFQDLEVMIGPYIEK